MIKKSKKQIGVAGQIRIVNSTVKLINISIKIHSHKLDSKKRKAREKG